MEPMEPMEPEAAAAFLNQIFKQDQDIESMKGLIVLLLKLYREAIENGATLHEAFSVTAAFVSGISHPPAS